jgi:periplasmic protein TonB
LKRPTTAALPRCALFLTGKRTFWPVMFRIELCLDEWRRRAMFELFTGDHRRAAHRGSIPALITTVAHVIVLGVVLVVPILYVSANSPDVPRVMAFSVPAVPPPPPPPPPPAPASQTAKPKVTKLVPALSPRAAPVEAPQEIVEETPVDPGSEEGVPGGVEGGVPGGVVGGVPGGLITNLPPPPPPPPPPVPVTREPVRIGGELKAPALIERVEPRYPVLAVQAKVQGVVILEALVDRQGRVEDVRVLRSVPLLDNAAVAAVKRWRYSPLFLNGQPERFVLTVTVNFSLGR